MTDETTSWWTISGETTAERVRDGLPQLLLLSVLVWAGTRLAYTVLSSALDPITATLSVLLGAVYVGLRLRRWLTPGGTVDEDEDGDQDEDGTENAAPTDDATDAEATEGTSGSDATDA